MSTTSYEKATDESGSDFQSEPRSGLHDHQRLSGLVLQPEALQGLAGDIVKAIEPNTEADPVAILIYFLTAFGNMIGHYPHWTVEKSPHYLNLFAVLVGDTSRGRKGTSRSTVDYIFRKVDIEWHNSRIRSGLSSGQGLIWNVRDEVIKESEGDDGKTKKTVVDKGEPDKRLLVVEEELSTVLKATPQEGNILSAILRQAWDSGNLRTLTSGRVYNPVVATGAHVSIIGHITKQELLRYLDSTEQCNGFGNRFLWFIVEQSKLIPNPQGTPDEILAPLIQRVREAVKFGSKAGKIIRDENAELVWAEVYVKLMENAEGMFGAMTARGAPQIMRLSALFALLDLCPVIRPEHLNAAIALWDYSSASVRLIFGDTLGDPIADKIINAIKRSDDGLTLTEISNLFSRHHGSKIEPALQWLMQTGAVKGQKIETSGRPKMVYHQNQPGGEL